VTGNSNLASSTGGDSGEPGKKGNQIVPAVSDRAAMGKPNPYLLIFPQPKEGKRDTFQKKKGGVMQR